MNIKLLCAICSIALLGCGKTGPDTPAPATNAAASLAPASNVAAQPNKEAPVQIRGLYPGMDIQSVPDAMMTILAEQGLADFGFTDVLKAGDGSGCVLMYTKPFLRAIEARARDRQGEARAAGKLDEEIRSSCANSEGVLIVKSGADDKVYRVEFNDVKNLFNANGMTPAEFAQKLARDEHVPEMKPNDAQTAWTYTSPDGNQIEIITKDVLGISMMRLNMGRAAQ